MLHQPRKVIRNHAKLWHEAIQLLGKQLIIEKVRGYLDPKRVDVCGMHDIFKGQIRT